MVKLKQQHLPISKQGYFKLPLPKNFNHSDTHFPKKFAKKSLEGTIEPWYEQLSHHLDNQHVRAYLEEYIPTLPELRRQKEEFILRPLHWEISYQFLENGFMSYLSLGRNIGTLYINQQDIGEYISYQTIPPHNLKEFFSVNSISSDKKGIRVLTYQPHNIERLPEALFLREWGRRYINRCLRESLFEK